MAEELARLRRGDGRSYPLRPLPLPRPIQDRHGQWLPAGYANFLVLNDVVLMPAYDDPADALAARQLAAAFPQRRVLAIDSRPLISQGGALHCLTMQIPKGAVIL
jgi:agmatine/peptidylarginine deiminase